METLIVSKNEDTITLTYGNNILEIDYSGVCDYHFTLKRFLEFKEFIIEKSSGEIYDIFNTLYQEISECRILDGKHIDKDWKKRYEYQQIFHADKQIISWISDDVEEDIATTLYIIKKENAFILSFRKGINAERDIIHGDPRVASVRIRTSGSRYDLFYMPFVRFYQKLSNSLEKGETLSLKKPNY